MNDDYAKFEELLGRTVVGIEGAKVGSDQITLSMEDGRKFIMWHSQDCCESVSVEDIDGDVQDLLGSPIVQAEESTNSKENPSDIDPKDYSYQESFTWTFYRIGTAKGSVVIRWYGSSNGYYSERVDCRWEGDSTAFYTATIKDQTAYMQSVIDRLSKDVYEQTCRADRATKCIEEIRAHQQKIAGTMSVRSAIMTIIKKWEKWEEAEQKKLKETK